MSRADISASLRELAADRSQKENKPKNGRHGGAFTGPIAIVADSIQFQDDVESPSPAPASPVGAFPGATISGEYALNDARQTQMQATQPIGGDDRNLIGSWKLGVDAASAQNETGGDQKFYRNNGSASDTAKMPVLGNVPVIGNLFEGRRRSVNAPPVTPLPSAPDNYSWGSFDASTAPPVGVMAPAPANQPTMYYAYNSDVKGFDDDNFNASAIQSDAAKELPRAAAANWL